jgi:hypothetical protein
MGQGVALPSSRPESTRLDSNGLLLLSLSLFRGIKHPLGASPPSLLPSTYPRYRLDCPTALALSLLLSSPPPPPRRAPTAFSPTRSSQFALRLVGINYWSTPSTTPDLLVGSSLYTSRRHFDPVDFISRPPSSTFLRIHQFFSFLAISFRLSLSRAKSSSPLSAPVTQLLIASHNGRQAILQGSRSQGR